MSASMVSDEVLEDAVEVLREANYHNLARTLEENLPAIKNDKS